MHASSAPSRKTGSLPVLALTALGFVLGTCEFVIVGILPDIAADLGVSLSAVGRLVSVFAGCYAVGTPVITAATGRVPRFRLLLVLLALFLAVNAMSMLAPGAAVLYLSRVLAALVSGPLTAVAMLFARDVAAPGRTARAISMVYAGFSVASVVGVPLGTAVCQRLGWRWTFGVILAMGTLLAPVLFRLLPRPAAAPAQEGFLRQFAVLRDRRCWLCVVMIVCSGAGTYIVYTYLTPVLTQVLGVGAAAVSPLLLVVGVCCLGSNLLSGWLGEHGGIRRLPAVFAAQTALFALMPLLLKNLWTGLGAVLAMALLMYVLNTPAQVHALELAEREYPFAATLCASVLSVSYNLGIAVGSFVGSGVQEQWGLAVLGLPAAGFTLAGLAVNLCLLGALRRPAGRRERAASRAS